jgi:hypothetical protein
MATVEKLPDALRDRTAGATRVIEARAHVGEDSEGRTALFVTLVLSNPAGDTWPVDDLWELRRGVQSVIAEVDPDLDLPWFVTFEPENAEQQETDDTREQVDADY